MTTTDQPMDLHTRHRIEQDFHDAKAREGVDDFYGFGALEAADTYVFESLGDLRGRRVLELGCGDGETSVRLARAGASVVAIDISPEMIGVARQRAAQAGFADAIETRATSGEDLDFPDHSFDAVYGHSILHHLNLDVSMPHIARMLKPGGLAAFLEPLDHNPLINGFRRLTPNRRTPTEKPLSFRQLASVASHFSGWEHREFYLFSLLAFVWYYGLRSRTLFRCTLAVLQPVDRMLFAFVPFLRRYAWVTVLRLKG